MPALTEDQRLILLRHLAAGEPVALASLAQAAGISPASISEAMSELTDHGVRERRDGSLRVPGGVDLLSATSIQECILHELSDPPAIEVLGVTGSTNDVVRARIEAGSGIPLAVLGEAQTAGRGRRGRGWTSPVASNVYLSQAESLGGGLDGASGLSLVAGVAVAEAIEASVGVSVALKWPNDLLVAGRKLGGILVELIAAARASIAIVGIGINVRVPKYAQPGIDQAWIDLESAANSRVSRNQLAGALIVHVHRAITQFRERGFDLELRRRWQARDPFSDRRVIALSDQGELRGWGRGIDGRGAFVIETDNGEVTLAAGEVSLRLEEGA